MTNQCNTCKAEIRAEDLVVACEGFCDGYRYFHAKCVGLSYDESCACLHRNIFWMCDSCSDMIEKGRFRKAVKDLQESNDYATKSEINELKTEVKRISEMISLKETNVAEVSNKSASSSHSEAQNFIGKHSTPIASSSVNDNHHVADIENDTINLYISNIAIDVTIEELKEMVCESTGAKNVMQVKCLVSSWRNVSTLDYLSYKVSIDAQYRKSALKKSNWPNGVWCREFIDNPNVAWRPINRTT